MMTTEMVHAGSIPAKAFTMDSEKTFTGMYSIWLIRLDVLAAPVLCWRVARALGMTAEQLRAAAGGALGVLWGEAGVTGGTVDGPTYGPTGSVPLDDIVCRVKGRLDTRSEEEKDRQVKLEFEAALRQKEREAEAALLDAAVAKLAGRMAPKTASGG